MTSISAEAIEKSTLDLSSDNALLEYLSKTPYACSAIIPLSGGVSNFTYRGQLSQPLPSGENTIIIKHTEPYVARNKSYVLDSIRSHFEQAALTGLIDLPVLLYDQMHISTPTLHHFLRDSSTQIIQDFPNSTDLKTCLLTHTISESQANLLGSALGSWTRTFHTWGASPESTNLRDTMGQNSNAVDLKFAVNAGRLILTADAFPKILDESRDMFTEIAAGLRSRSRKDNPKEKSLIHGDFWTGNILLQNSPISADCIPQSEPRKLLIVDWELSHLSIPSYDLGQCFAELYLPKHFRDIDAGVLMIKAFLRKYGPIPLEDAFDTALHFGIHLTVWNRIWGSEEQIEKCVEVGRDFIRSAWQRNREWFRGGPLNDMFF